MEVEARPGSEPDAHFGMFVCGVIVDDEVDIEGRRDIGVDMLEKGEEFLVAMTCATLREDPAIGDVEGCEQGRRAMPDVIVGDTLNIAEPKREHRLRTFQSLNLALLIDAQHNGLIGGIEVQADDVPDLVDEQRIGGKVEAFGAVWLNAEQCEHPRDSALRQAGLLRRGSHGPVASRRWLRFENRPKKVGNHFFIVAARSPGPRFTV
jgi:hypothetical protein